MSRGDPYTFSRRAFFLRRPLRCLPPGVTGRETKKGGAPFFETNPISAQERFTSIGRIVYNTDHQNALKPGRVITIANMRYGSRRRDATL